MALSFEWDKRKAELNLKAPACRFKRPPLCSLTPYHSSVEMRFLDIGLSYLGRVLMVAYTERGNKIRLISARLATRNERKQYRE